MSLQKMWGTHSSHQNIIDTLILKREIITTQDGSSSIYVKDLDETYHSVYGALQEAIHVYIENGLRRCNKPAVNVLEMGFGTGLNFLLTYKDALHYARPIRYVGVEAYPLIPEEWRALNYHSLAADLPQSLEQIHQLKWNEAHVLHDYMHLTKIQSLFQEFEYATSFDIIYYDAFGYNYQPELWTEALLKKMFTLLATDGFLVTYACKGVIKQNLRSAGFEIKRLPGPPGKREMTVAYKRG